MTMQMAEKAATAFCFWVAEAGLEPEIRHAVSPEVYWNTDFGPNLTWYEVKVGTEEVKDKWVAARNNQLSARWTPNQDRADRAHYKKIDKEAEKIMDDLEL